MKWRRSVYYIFYRLSETIRKQHNFRIQIFFLQFLILKIKTALNIHRENIGNDYGTWILCRIFFIDQLYHQCGFIACFIACLLGSYFMFQCCLSSFWYYIILHNGSNSRRFTSSSINHRYNQIFFLANDRAINSIFLLIIKNINYLFRF